MPCTLQADESGRTELVFQNEPSFIHALKIAPEAMEAELNSGDWMILVFSVWSIYDVRAIADVIDCVKQFEGEFNLGVRPYDYPEEFQSWWPTPLNRSIGRALIREVNQDGRKEVHISSDPNGTPALLFLRDGIAIQQEFGQRSKEEIARMIQTSFLSQ